MARYESVELSNNLTAYWTNKDGKPAFRLISEHGYETEMNYTDALALVGFIAESVAEVCRTTNGE